MPKRNRIKVYKGGPQGDDAELVMHLSTIGEIRKRQTIIIDLNESDEESDNEKAKEESSKLIADHVVSWNWVDDDNNKLILPKDDIDVLENLTSDEMSFLGDCFANKSSSEIAAKKNY